jgi:hypothetical protein
MKLETCQRQLNDNAERIQALVTGISIDEARWKSDPDSWSALEVISHLYDEEREDFRARLDVILHHPDQPWSPIDPQGWVESRQYNARELEASLADFINEREASISWLRTLSSPNWDASYRAPFGRITAGDMMASWVSHDLLHMRQLVEIHREYVTRQVEPFKGDYAGPW